MKGSTIARRILVTASVACGAMSLTGCEEAVRRQDPKPVPVVSIADTRIPESINGAATEAEFTITLTPASEQVVTVDYTTADVTAEAGKDYTVANGTSKFSPGQTTKTITVAIIDDSLVWVSACVSALSDCSVRGRLTDRRAGPLGEAGEAPGG